MSQTFSNITSLFLSPRTEAKYRTSSVFASPSLGGAFIWTPTPSEVIPKNRKYYQYRISNIEKQIVLNYLHNFQM